MDQNYFGEYALLEDQEWEATVIAASYLVVYTVSKKPFLKFLAPLLTENKEDPFKEQ